MPAAATPAKAAAAASPAKAGAKDATDAQQQAEQQPKASPAGKQVRDRPHASPTLHDIRLCISLPQPGFHS